MLAEAASPLGVEVIVLDPTPDCPAAPVARDQIVADFDDPRAVRELGTRTDVVTYEIELADPGLLEQVRDELAVPVQPDPETLRTIQDKLRQKQTFEDSGIPVPAFDSVESPTDIERAVERYGGVMVKAREGGYDGRGNVPVSNPGTAAEAYESIGGSAMAEEFLDFERELAIIGVTGADERRIYSVTETIHREEILRTTVTPARTTDAVSQRARSIAEDVLAELPGRGVFGIELFETKSNDVLVNEIAPRPHNSGHWTIEGAVTSQFENHIRAILGWPLGSTSVRDPTVTVNLLGNLPDTTDWSLSGMESVLSTPNAHLHWYGKREVRPLRKMGHVTLTTLDGESTADGETGPIQRARDLRERLTFTSDATDHEAPESGDNYTRDADKRRSEEL